MSVTLTIELPDELGAALERAARERGRSKEDVVREAIARDVPAVTEGPPPLPRFGLFDGPPDLSERVDEYLQGFGED